MQAWQLEFGPYTCQACARASPAPTYIVYTHSLTSEFYFKGCSGFKDDGGSDGGNWGKAPLFSSIWTETHYVAKPCLKIIAILLSQHPRFQNYRYELNYIQLWLSFYSICCKSLYHSPFWYSNYPKLVSKNSLKVWSFKFFLAIKTYVSVSSCPTRIPEPSHGDLYFENQNLGNRCARLQKSNFFWCSSLLAVIEWSDKKQLTGERVCFILK